jgi:hypothetical protein
MNRRRRFLQGAACAGLGFYFERRGYGQAGQTVSTVGNLGTHISAPPAGHYPYSGVSGPGHQLTSTSGTGGWHSGSAGVAYQGAFPPA